MKKIIVFLLLLLISQVSFSTDTSAVKYLPLAVGNKWVHTCYCTIYPIPVQWDEKTVITKDSIINGKKYFLFSGGTLLSGLIRVDTLTGNILRYNPSACPEHPMEDFIDSLAAKINDNFFVCSGISRVCIDTSSYQFASVLYKAKKFNNVIIIVSMDNRYAKNIGIVVSHRGDANTYTYILKGCLINGIVYGDTNVVGINKISSIIPEKFSLYQNYPNPFNPSTKIKFSIPLLRGVDGAAGRGVFTKLVIYDVLGKEVATLIPPLRGGQEGLQPGTYEVEWDGSNYPSGVYFYKLTSDDFTETKRMVLIK